MNRCRPRARSADNPPRLDEKIRLGIGLGKPNSPVNWAPDDKVSVEARGCKSAAHGESTECNCETGSATFGRTNCSDELNPVTSSRLVGAKDVSQTGIAKEADRLTINPTVGFRSGSGPHDWEFRLPDR
ncbi:hypothetical protein Salat_0211300 [Sesamum alatum]|uniref:Uncharacterized protein n=1 Tax=Sesamum alatum TaxID=300844 RepID=A0AAE2CY14_9LAMI|nr:hypothetical protein Salat_0211300 [Sesamum alatum]